MGSLGNGIPGKDDGTFKTYVATEHQRPFCQHCHQDVDVAIKYGGGEAGLKGIIKKYDLDPNSKTLIVKTHTLPLGVTCGCYAKWQRQLVHISHARSKQPR